MTARNLYLVAYDIADPRRLARVHRLLKNYALPVQYSVFIAWLNETQLDELVEQLRQRIDNAKDDVRLYHLPAQAKLATFGKQWLPDGVHLLNNGHLLQPQQKDK
jgi:CRISPR-associated protein Cas2